MKNKWTVAYASVIGNSHIQLGLPCQDNSAYEAINENWGVAVVCDGAGSASHAHLGSELTAKFAIKYFAEMVKMQGWHEADELPSDELWKGSAIVALRKIRADLGHLAEAENLKVNALASTVIVVAHSPKGLLVAHIGDGRAGFCNGEKWFNCMNPFQGAEANETVFITSDIWGEDEIPHYVRAHVVRDNVTAFTLLSDGCEKSSFEVNIFNSRENKFFDLNKPFPKFFEPNVKGLKMLHKEGKTQEEINQLWSGFLTNGTAQFKTETDDKTMILGVLNEVELAVESVVESENLEVEASEELGSDQT
jgi:hypothetical protein